ncbi:MAG: hypothetical protein QW613_04725, partial [Thermoprotei archaeon]
MSLEAIILFAPNEVNKAGFVFINRVSASGVAYIAGYDLWGTCFPRFTATTSASMLRAIPWGGVQPTSAST